MRSLWKQVVPERLRAIAWEYRNPIVGRGARATRRLIRRRGAAVQSGPFEGMRYIRHASGSSYPPKLIGSYECELHATIRAALRRGYDRVIDIGAAEGYYAVGFARGMRGARVIAFESDAQARAMLLDLSRTNDVVDRVDIRGACDVASLCAIADARESTLVVCDCEGFESTLFGDARVLEAMKRSDLIIETHDFVEAQTTQHLMERLASTHELTLIPARARIAEDWPPALDFVPARWRVDAMSEFRRFEQSWIVGYARKDS